MGSDLVAMPYKNGSFCRRKEGKLIVVVRNRGGEETDTDRGGQTYTKVSWGQGGVYGNPRNPEKNTKKLDPGEEEILEFECPPECFAPDCKFYITVDSRHELTNEKRGRIGVDEGAYDDTFNNIKKGVCLERDKPFLPDLIPEQYEDTKTYYKREDTTLKVKIRNKGTAIAGKSKVEVKFDNGDKKTKDVKELEPGDMEEIEIPIPAEHHTGNFRIKITADVKGKVGESKESNNVARDMVREVVEPL